MSNNCWFQLPELVAFLLLCHCKFKMTCFELLVVQFKDVTLSSWKSWWKCLTIFGHFIEQTIYDESSCVVSEPLMHLEDTEVVVFTNGAFAGFRLYCIAKQHVLKRVWHSGYLHLQNVSSQHDRAAYRFIRSTHSSVYRDETEASRCCGCTARWGELAWGCLGSGPVRRGALWAMLCVSVSIHSRRGALSVLPRTRCQTPLPPPSMLPPRGQPAEWRTSLPGCLRTCVSHTHSHIHTHTHTQMSSDSYTHWSVVHLNRTDWFLSVFLASYTVNVSVWLKW